MQNVVWYFASALGIGVAVLWIGLAIGFFAMFTPLILGRCAIGPSGDVPQVSRRMSPRTRSRNARNGE